MVIRSNAARDHIGIPIYERTENLRDLLNSIPSADLNIGTVYVADDGHSEERQHLYDGDWSFDLIHIDIEYNSGLAAKRNAIVREIETEYVLFVDSDHLLPANLSILRDQLDAAPTLGAIAGAEVNPIRGRFEIYAHDFTERNGGSVLVRDIKRDQKSIDQIAGYPLIKFDMTATPRLFRRACLEEQSWDDRYVIGREHIDFCVSHWKQTDWEFAVSPSVIFTHQPGNNSTTSEGSFRNERAAEETHMFLDKWRYDEIEGIHTAWVDSLETRYPSIQDIGITVKRQIRASR